MALELQVRSGHPKVDSRSQIKIAMKQGMSIVKHATYRIVVFMLLVIVKLTSALRD